VVNKAFEADGRSGGGIVFPEDYNVIGVLPKRRRYRPAEKKSGKKIEYRTPQDIADGFVVCGLCWRSVPKLVRIKKIHLCHLHDIPARHRNTEDKKVCKNTLLIL
jgi:hypothetical protein